MLLVGLTSVLGFICAGLREKVPQIARMSVWDFSGFGGFQRHLAAIFAASSVYVAKIDESNLQKIIITLGKPGLAGLKQIMLKSE